MWTKLLELVSRIWFEYRKPRRRLARAIMSLYLDMKNCQESYVTYRNHSVDENFSRWADAVERLRDTLDQVRAILEIYDRSLVAGLDHYVFSEESVALRQRRSFRQLLRRKLVKKEVRRLNALENHLDEVTEWIDEEQRVKLSTDSTAKPTSNFLPIMKQLSDFIKENFTIDEIFDAK